jgi:hypothetical protein
MEHSQITNINRHIYHEYPEFVGINPTIQNQGENYLFTYKKTVQLDQGKALKRYLRLVIAPTGNILKVSTSR